MRLIDADKIDFGKVFIGASDFAKDAREEAQKLIDEQPTAYNADKVVEQLEEYAHSSICKSHDGCPYIGNEDISCENCGAIGALEIAKSGGIE